MNKKLRSPHRFIASLILASVVSMALLSFRIIESDSLRYIFLFWNLILAAFAPLIAWWLVVRIRKYGWMKWQQIALTILWTVFLPNSFYVITDFIHLRATYEASLFYDIAMLSSFTFSAVIMGYISVYMIHVELRKHLSINSAWAIVGILFLASSFAIYLGRFTRWNTWDILLKPAGLLFDVSDRFVNPAAHSETYQVTLVFFALFFSVYWVTWEAAQLIKRA